MALEPLFERREFHHVTFSAAHHDVVVFHELGPQNPDHVDFIVMQKSTPCDIYVNRTVGFRPWGANYIVVRCDTDNAEVDLLLFLRNEQIDNQWRAPLLPIDKDFIGSINIADSVNLTSYDGTAEASIFANSISWAHSTSEGYFGVAGAFSGNAFQKLYIESKVTGATDPEVSAIDIKTLDGGAAAFQYASRVFLGTSPNDGKTGCVFLGTSGRSGRDTSIELSSANGDIILTAAYAGITVVGELYINSHLASVQGSSGNNLLRAFSSDGYYAGIYLIQENHGAWLIYNPANNEDLYLNSGAVNIIFTTTGALTLPGTLQWGGGAAISSSNDVSQVGHSHAWGDVSKVGSSLADLATKSAAALDSGTLDDGRLSANVAKLNADIIPTTTGFDLGSSTNYFADIYADPGAVTDARYPLVWDTSDKLLKHKTDGSDTAVTEPVTGLTVEKGIVTGVSTVTGDTNNVTVGLDGGGSVTLNFTNGIFTGVS